MKDIIKITKLEDFSITNANGTLYKNQKVLFVYFRDNTRRIIDLIADCDITYRVSINDLILNINDDIMKNEKVLWVENKWEE